MRPDVSVVMPVRNGGRFLAPALASVFAQDGVFFEVVAIDDGSTDGSAEVLAEFAMRYDNIRIERGEGAGLSRALNLGMAAARGRYVARMDGDDIALPGRLAQQYHHMERHPEIGVLGTQARIIGEDDEPLGRMRVPVGAVQVRRALAVSAPIVHPAVMMRRDLVIDCGGYRPFFDGAEDYDLWLRLSARTEIDNLPATLLLYRRHPGQQTVRLAFRQARLAALAYVSHRLRSEGGRDVEFDGDWQSALAAVDSKLVWEVRQLTASRLVDNGGTLDAIGARYFRRACQSAAANPSREVRGRMALACVRHQLRLARANRRGEALAAVPADLLRWRTALLGAYLRHASILWRSGAP